MLVTIRYRTTDGALRTRQVIPGDEAHPRALWLAQPSPEGLVVDCAVDQVLAAAVLGEDQDPTPYLSPRYVEDEPHVLALLDDEERRRRYVEQARRCAAYLREHYPGEGGTFRRLAAATLAALTLACAPAAPPELGQDVRAAAAEALEAGALLATETEGPLRGYVLREGSFVLWTLPGAEPGPAPETAVAAYDARTGHVVALGRAQ